MKILCFISTHSDQPKVSKILVQNESKVLLKKSTHKIKQPKNLQKSLHLEYYISTHHNKSHPQTVNILFIVELQKNIEFYVSNFIQNIGDCNHRSNCMDRI